MHLPTGMMEPEEHTRNNRHDIFFVVDVRQTRNMRIDVVRKRLVAHARHSVCHSLECRPCREVEGKEDGVEEGDGSSEGVADDRYRCSGMCG